MEFSFDLNAIFPERISVLDHNLTTGRKALGRPDPQHQISRVIDELGKASAKAQQLAAPITSAAKLQTNRHHLYLLKEGESNGGRGLAVGFLKVGYKKLFLLDQQGAHVEIEPLCILDFFVTESLQRHGYGLELFSYMLQHKRVEPVRMAYDRPSPKFLSFLEKHYCLKGSVPQVNNFVVFDGFFRDRSAARLRKALPKKPEGEIKPYSLTEREVVREEQRALPWPFAPPSSPPLSLPSQCTRSQSVGSSPSRGPPRPRPAPPTPHAQYLENLNCRARRTSQPGLVARSNLYSRHLNSRDLGLLLERQPSSLKLPGLQPVQREREADTKGQTAALGHTDVDRPISSAQTAAPCLPPLPQTSVGPQESGGPERGNEAGSEKDGGGEGVRERGGGGWSWTVGEPQFTAQWVRRKQEFRSTRPW
ncbi:alpha-tubulin N-acetyltransferase 1 isoform X1 [Conger conger]|uniref:alpha-tubulin N-acetyltransferase 1 isoform X1 n=1 Tax=Conger conger TaxID=82655 RepID=UPI002A59E58A|nr:alpha-tubulin N-acetyltransferase 1 isoform X1 [Conger conger]